VPTRPSPLTENDQETADGENVTNVMDSEVERSIDVIEEVTPGSLIAESPATRSSERTQPQGVHPLLPETTPHHGGSTSV